jgi:N-acetylneuraminate synthase
MSTEPISESDAGSFTADRGAHLREAEGPCVSIGHHVVGAGQPVFVIAEIGINHNGDVELAKALVDVAAAAGCDAVKFQKRWPLSCVPRDQWLVERDTPWGRMTYLEYRERIELGEDAYAQLADHCRARGVSWFASCWDQDSVDFIERFEPPCYKVASASLTDLALLSAIRETGRPIILSTGAALMEDVDIAVERIGTSELLIAHTNSTYPCPSDQLNLKVIGTLAARFPECPIGYSGHEAGLAPSLAAVALGATFVERHITLDRTMWGTDQPASLEPRELAQLVASIRELERALGDGIKRRYPSEMMAMRKLRRFAPVRAHS